MAWSKDNSVAAKLAAAEALAQAERAELAADSIDEKQPLIDEFIGEQTNLQTQLDDLVLQSGTDIAEVVQARGGFPTVNARLTDTDAQLTDTAKKSSEISLIPNTLNKLKSGVDVLIEIVGDSLTEGVGATSETNYTAIFTDKLATLFPNSTVIRYDGIKVTADAPISDFGAGVTIQTGTNGQTIRVKRNGIGGDTTLMLGRRIANFTSVFEGKKPDLVTICVGINDSLTGDATRYVPANRFKAHLDGLIRNIKQRTGAEIAVISPPSTYSPTLADYSKSAKEVAEMNKISFVDAYALWVSHYVEGTSFSGQDTWGSDTWHPSILGHLKLGELVFDTLFVNNQKIIPLQQNSKIYWYDDPLFSYGGGWAVNTIDNLADGKSVYKEYAGALGYTLSFSVYANEIAILSRRNQDGGKFTYSVDGGSAKEIDVLVPNPTSRTNVSDQNSASMPAEKIIIASGLDDTLHSVTITVTQSWMLFSGIEIILNDTSKFVKNDKSFAIPVQPEQPVMNNGSYSVTGTGITYAQLPITFTKTHKTIPTVIATTKGVDAISYVAATSNETINGVVIYISRKDNAVFSATVDFSYISIDS